VLAQLVPVGRPSHVVAFLPEKDRAFLAEKAAVKLELDRLPVGEFGSLVGRVSRISDDVASEAEVEAHLGPASADALFRVDMQIESGARNQKLFKFLQSGARLTVRAPLRSRRILSLMFDPIRRLLD
jgi:hypothetical protein